MYMGESDFTLAIYVQYIILLVAITSNYTSIYIILLAVKSIIYTHNIMLFLLLMKFYDEWFCLIIITRDLNCLGTFS